MSLLEHLQIEKNKCISICGSGGKSSLCFALAKELLFKGKRSAITTTTHIGIPRSGICKLYMSDERNDLLKLLDMRSIIVAGKKEGNKLCYGGNAQFEILSEETDTLLVEADGSKMLPLKYPNDTEPVIPGGCDTLITVCGLSAWNRKIRDVCQRNEIAYQVLPCLGEIVDAEAMAKILWNGYGALDPVFVLNQADSEELWKAGLEVKQLLETYGAKRVFVVSLKNMGFASERYF